MIGYITQYFRGQVLYLRKHRVNVKTKAFIWSADKDRAMRMSTARAVDLMKIMKGFCSPAMVDRRGCVITTGGTPKTKQELNAELKWLREAQRNARCYGRSLHMYERWQKRQHKVRQAIQQLEDAKAKFVLRLRTRAKPAAKRFTAAELNEKLQLRMRRR